MHKRNAPFERGALPKRGAHGYSAFFLLAIVGDVNSHAHLFPWIGLFVDLHNAAFKHVGMAKRSSCAMAALLSPGT